MRFHVTLNPRLARLAPVTFLAVLAAFSPDRASAWPELTAAPRISPDSGLTGPVLAAASEDEITQYYFEHVDPDIQRYCVACHSPGGTAQKGGARIILGSNTSDNHHAFEDFVADEAEGAEWILEKVVGGQGHGGGAVIAEGSAFFNALAEYLNALEGEDLSESVAIDFWRGTDSENRDITLRRASLLLAGEVARHRPIQNAKTGDAALRSEVLALMRGPGFKDFLTTGANDRLLISGLENGIDFNISTRDRYPEISELLASLPDERPEEFEEYHDKPFLTSGDAEWMFRRAVGLEPLELIAHIVMTDKPYTEILTADYTMVNAFSDLAYRSDSGFSHEFADESGFLDRRLFGEFQPGQNTGHIPHDEEFESDDGVVVSFSNYQSWPHAGVLSTQAWLARYPSTDTNRNRARARWTYFHFLGVDIERSAPRTTDPVALADTDNPTLKNSACTVCHERLDPVAGSYQSFGDIGHYLDQWGGKDSLSDAYKCPECYGGEWGSTGYQEGDTWYRDMRAPGYEGAKAELSAGGEADSLQWLGKQMVQDPRFASATVRFWWPAVFGAEPLSLPEDADGPDYDQRLLAFEAQEATVTELARGFEQSGYDLKALLADMVMSPWYRNSTVTDPALTEGRSVELRTVGRGRLLTPEELDRKNVAVFGRTWKQWGDGTNAHSMNRQTALQGDWAPYSAFYGGIDGAVVTKRNRDMTPLMSNVAETMAIDLSCQVVVEDFDRLSKQRKVFRLVDKYTVPGSIARETVSLAGKVSSMGQYVEHEITQPAKLVGGITKIKINDMTGNAHESIDDQWTGAELLVREISLKQGGDKVLTISGADFERADGFAAEQWRDDEGTYHWRGNAEQKGWRMHPGAWVEVSVDLPAGDYTLAIELGTALLENNKKDAMTAMVSALALENQHKTESGKDIRQQIAGILRRATSREPAYQEVTAMMTLLKNSAADAKKRTPWYRDQGNHCETWYVWPDEELEHDEYWDRYHDGEGMMRGWSTVLHAVMSSYGYLHD